MGQYGDGYDDGMARVAAIVQEWLADERHACEMRGVQSCVALVDRLSAQLDSYMDEYKRVLAECDAYLEGRRREREASQIETLGSEVK